METRSSREKIAGELVREIQSRVSFLLDVGLGYLTLHRGAASLSGGEAQRIRLAAQLGSGLCGVLYVLDEPTIGLHPRDNDRLIGAMHRLRDLGNTLLVVEHDHDVIKNSDYICDFGPRAGRLGGRIVAEDLPDRYRRWKNPSQVDISTAANRSPYRNKDARFCQLWVGNGGFPTYSRCTREQPEKYRSRFTSWSLHCNHRA